MILLLGHKRHRVAISSNSLPTLPFQAQFYGFQSLYSGNLTMSMS